MPKQIPLFSTLWLIVFATSFFVFSRIEPTGSSFTRGINRAIPVILLQLLALLLALATLIVALRNRDSVNLFGWLLAISPLAAMLIALAIRVSSLNP